MYDRLTETCSVKVDSVAVGDFTISMVHGVSNNTDNLLLFTRDFYEKVLLHAIFYSNDNTYLLSLCLSVTK